MRNNQTCGFCSIFGAHKLTEVRDKKYKKCYKKTKTEHPAIFSFDCVPNAALGFYFISRGALLE